MILVDLIIPCKELFDGFIVDIRAFLNWDMNDRILFGDQCCSIGSCRKERNSSNTFAKKNCFA